VDQRFEKGKHYGALFDFWGSTGILFLEENVPSELWCEPKIGFLES